MMDEYLTEINLYGVLLLLAMKPMIVCWNYLKMEGFSRTHLKALFSGFLVVFVIVLAEVAVVNPQEIGTFILFNGAAIFMIIIILLITAFAVLKPNNKYSKNKG